MPSGQASRLGFWNLLQSPTPPGPGDVDPTPINVLADFIVVDYSFTNGRDLDTRTRFETPLITSEYVGWARLNSVSNVLFWGGDNTGTGVESVLININNYRTQVPATYPSEFQIDFRCFWFDTVGTDPVYLTAYLYTGGTMLKQGFTWVNPTATAVNVLTSTGKVITLEGGAFTDGEALGNIVYNVNTGVGAINIT
jgi:hypothetical protein